MDRFSLTSSSRREGRKETIANSDATKNPLMKTRIKMRKMPINSTVNFYHAKTEREGKVLRKDYCLGPLRM